MSDAPIYLAEDVAPNLDRTGGGRHHALLGLSSGVANARVEIATGADAGRAATIDPTKCSR